MRWWTTELEVLSVDGEGWIGSEVMNFDVWDDVVEG